jgi:hypothetical protein
MKIAFLGNFSVPYSTESHHKLTWEKLGHEVIALQENRAITDEIISACKKSQIFSWTHTHGWTTPGSILLTEMLSRIHDMGVKSFAYHLDVYFGLETWDHRDSLVGKHPEWKVQHWFSTVGSKEAEFKSRGVNHHWLPPGVVEYGCYEGNRQPGLAVDVGCAGSANYHPEYPFRGIMVAALQRHYGPRFRVFQGYREQNLNNLYASVKVMVGDHCFAGQPKYWSDRLPETCGRGGFILYPRTEGMAIPTATYEPQNVADLIAKIDYYLAHEAEREEIRKRCFEHVKAHDTYTHRLQEVLQVMELA